MNPDIIAIDVETTGLNPYKDKLLGVSVATLVEGEIRSRYYPHSGEISSTVNDWLANPVYTKVGHNLRFDIKFLMRNGYEVKGKWEDTLLLAQLIDENKPLGLKALTKDYLGINNLGYYYALQEHLKELKIKMSDFADPRVDQELVGKYCAEDAENTLKLYYMFMGMMKPGALRYYREEMILLEPVLASMELRGNRIDLNALNQAEIALSCYIESYQEQLAEEVSAETMLACKMIKDRKGLKDLPVFNWNSGEHKRTLFYELLGLGAYTDARTEKGTPSLQKTILKNLKLPEGKLKKVLGLQTTLQSYSKMKSTYVDGIKERLFGGVVHGEYYQAAQESWDETDSGGTVTGRLSHRNPNLGNLPRGVKGSSLEEYYLGSFAKDIFIPAAGHVFIYADYSQIELRVAAALSGDKEFLRVFKEGIDPHQETADALGITRQEGKTVNFLLIYLGSTWRLCMQLGWDPNDDAAFNRATSVRAGFYKRHSGLFMWLNEQRKFLETHLYVESLFKRRRHLLKIVSPDKKERNHALKQGMNFLVQSVAASICKRAMIELYAKDYMLVNQVHDSIACMVPATDTAGYEEEMRKISDIMTKVVDIGVPLEVDMKILKTFRE